MSMCKIVIMHHRTFVRCFFNAHTECNIKITCYFYTSKHLSYANCESKQDKGLSENMTDQRDIQIKNSLLYVWNFLPTVIFMVMTFLICHRFFTNIHCV